MMTTSVVMEKKMIFSSYHILGFQIPSLSNESNISDESRILDDEPLGTIFERKEKPLLITHIPSFDLSVKKTRHIQFRIM